MEPRIEEPVRKELERRGHIVKVAPGYARNYLIPKELAIEKRLDQEIKAVNLPGVSLPEAIEILKTQVGKDVNFVLDQDPALGLSAVQITLDLKDVTLRTLLYAMLLIGLNLIVDFAYTLLDPRVKYE